MMYFNKTNHDVTIFIENAVPVKFLAGEHKRLAQKGLEKQYGRFLVVVPDPADLREGKKKEEAKAEKGLINEVKQPTPDKELIKEPVTEEAKKGVRKVIKETPKVSEGYSPAAGEQTLASSGR